MKKYAILLFAALAFLSCGKEKKQEDSKKESLAYDEVYVCTGKYAKRFHCDEDCRGLQSCRSEIVVMSIEEAEDYGLTPCGYCY